MFFSSAPTPYDLRFRLFGFPVRIVPSFWIAALFPGAGLPPKLAVIWVGAVLVSVIVHELGHAVLQRVYGGDAEITLYAFGGAASAYGVRETWVRNVLISLAGPAAGFALAGLLYVGIQMLGPPPTEAGAYLATFLLFCNIAWGVLNLLPIWPLDGGRVSRELFVRFLSASRGVVASLWLSRAVAALGAAALVWFGSWFAAVWFALLAVESHQTLQRYRDAHGY